MDKNRTDEFRRWEEALASDDPAERRRGREALDACPEGRAILKRQDELDLQVARYRDAEHVPSATLFDRIAAAAAQAEAQANAGASAESAHAATRGKTRRSRALIAAMAIAASLALVWVGRIALTPGGAPGELGEAIARVEQAQRQYVRALADLELQAGGVLAGADQPGLAAPERHRLQALQARLENLDALIADVRSYLQDHPGNAGGQTALLAAYREKQSLLRDIVTPDPSGQPPTRSFEGPPTHPAGDDTPESGRSADPQGVRHAS